MSIGPDSPRVGQRMGRYTLLRRIATGGMAEVWLARASGASGFAKRVALKRILPHHAHEPRFVEMLVDEAKIAVDLSHPNVAQIFELGVDGQDFFIAMEYVPGPSLARIMVQLGELERLLPIPHAVHVVGEVAKGLAHAHAHRDPAGRVRGIVHRDVSPQNILLTYDGAVKLIDFGIARAEDRISRTHHGVIKGKLRYLAPEIAEGVEPDGRADVFCAGVVLFELLTGQALYAPRDDFEAIEMAARGQARSPREVNPKVPEALDAIVLRALARDREERFRTAAELQSELRRYSNRHHPGFVEGDLQAVMQTLFGSEAEQQRAEDAEAERIGVVEEVRSSEARTLVLASASRLGNGPGAAGAAPRVAASDAPRAAPPPRGLSGPGSRVLLGLALALAFVVGSLGYLWVAPAREPGGGPTTAPDSGLARPKPPGSGAPPTSGPPATDGGAIASDAPPVEPAEPSAGAEEAPPSLEPERKRTPKPRRVRFGTLDINARPRSKVWVDGRRIGETPLRRRVPAGRHRVVLEGPDGRRRRFVRTVRAGRTDELRYRW